METRPVRPAWPPCGPRLTARQREELAAHLGQLGGVDVDVVERAYLEAARTMLNGEYLRSLRTPEATKFRKHHTATAKKARELLALLDWEEPHGPMSDLTRDAGYSLGWSALHAHLERLAEVAEAEAATHTAAPRGRPRAVWRDDLIAAVADAYPDGTATKTRGGHFEDTIEMLLGWLGEPPDDTHETVIRALGGKKRARRAE